ncbi:hypothetical protein MFRU_011g00630 [Monilinia fructicola]|nr:hypothetical protein MFRU_011g00630 [Monilinia fructicola]
MEQLDTPASNLRKPITSPFSTGMTTAHLRQVWNRAPQMTRFNLSRRRLRALRTSDSRASKGEVTTGISVGSGGGSDGGGGDKVATTPKSTPTAQSPEYLVGEDLEDGFQETTVVVEVNAFPEGDLTPTGTIQQPSDEDISRPKQVVGTLPNRFLKTIAKRKKLRREKRERYTSLPSKGTASTCTLGEKADEPAAVFSLDCGGQSGICTPVTRPDIFSDETSDDSAESVSLEQLIRTARRTSNSQAMNNSWGREVSFSSGPSRLVLRASIKSNDEESDKCGKLGNIDIAILGLADKNDSSQPTNESEDASVEHKTQKDHQASQGNKKEKKKSRRLPVNELYLVSERVEGMTQEEEGEDVQLSAELADDPISQYTSDALQLIETVDQTKRERKRPQTYIYGAFGKIDNRVYRFPTPHGTSPQTEADNRHEVSPSYSDGFVGSEANPTGRFMLVPKPKRIGVSMWKLNTRVRQLDLVSRRYDELVDESNYQARRGVPARKPMKPLNKKTLSSAIVLVDATSQASVTDQAQQIDQDNQAQQEQQGHRSMREHQDVDDENPTTVNRISPSPQNMSVSRKVTFDERIEVDRPSTTCSLNSGECKECSQDKERYSSSDFQVHREMATVRLKRYHHEFDSEEEESSVDESEQSVVSILSDDDESEQSDETCDDSDEEMHTDTGDEDESGEDFDVPAALQGPADDQGDEIEISAEREPSEESEQSNEEDSNGENNHGFDEDMVLDEQVVGGNVIRIHTEGWSQRRESFMEPFEDLIPNEPQISRAARKFGDYSHPSQLPVTRIWKNTTAVQEADIWRPRKPKSSGVANETSEDIFDSPSPDLDNAKRRNSPGLQLRRKRTFSSLPLALTTSRLNTTPSPKVKDNLRLELEIPKTQFVAIRNVSPELGGSHGVDYFENPMQDDFLDKDGDILPPFSQLSFVPEEVLEGSYFHRASQTLMGSFQTPKSRAKSTPGRFHLKSARQGITPAAVQSKSGDTSSIVCETTIPPKFSQLSYVPTPRSEKSLSSITRKASFALGTLPASVRRQRAKTLAFIPPFKKAKLGI